MYAGLVAGGTSCFRADGPESGDIKSALLGLEYEVKAGFNIGGTSPLPLPVEIREITSYNPTLAVAIEGNVTKWFDVERNGACGSVYVSTIKG